MSLIVKRQAVLILKRLKVTGLVVRGLVAVPHSNPVFILGNQKAGTSAIAALLGKAAGCSTSIDLVREYLSDGAIYPQIQRGQADIEELIQRNRLDFSRKIIKEANLTPFFEHLATRFSSARFVFIAREPVDNIRSLLNRWDLPGNKKHLSVQELNAIKKSWHILFNGDWLGLSGDGYIEMMAERWRYLTDIYLKNADRMTLIRYEDFRADKQNAIENLAKQLSLPAENDISTLLNVQFQPKGRRDTNLLDFFGAENLRKIELICGQNMEQLGYNARHAPE